MIQYCQKCLDEGLVYCKYTLILCIKLENIKSKDRVYFEFKLDSEGPVLPQSANHIRQRLMFVNIT